MPRKNRSRPTRVEATKDKITTSALTLLLEKGAHALSISEICRTANVARPTLYRHFPTLEAVLEGVFYRVRDEFDRGLQRAIAADPQPQHRVDVLAGYMGDHLLTGRSQQLFHTNRQFTLNLVNKLFDSRVALYRATLSPFWDLIESVTATRIDRDECARILNHYYVSLNLEAVYSRQEQPAALLRKLIHSLCHITLDPGSDRHSAAAQGPRADTGNHQEQ